MSTAEQFAKLAVKAFRLSKAPGGKARISREDLLIACKGVDKLTTWVLLAKYSDDQWAAIQAVSELAAEMSTHKSAPADHMLVMKMATLCLQIHVSEALCPKCHGRGVIYPPGRPAVSTEYNEKTDISRLLAKPCTRCRGATKSPMNESKRASECGVQRWTWRDKGWDAMLTEYEQELAVRESSALSRIGRRLRGFFEDDRDVI